MRTLRLAALSAASALLLAACGGLQESPDASLETLAKPQTSPVYWFVDPPVLVDGALARANRGPNGINVTASTNGLPAGDAVTMWFIVFNEPDACSPEAPGGPPACGEDDVLPPGVNPEAMVGVKWAAGHVIGGSGRATFSGRLAVGDMDGVQFGHPLLDAAAAEVHIVLRGHGPMLPAFMPAQIKTLHGGCVTDPVDPGPNLCVDHQFAVFLP